MSDNEQDMPEVAPAHTEARADFSPTDLAMVVALGVVAIIAGAVLGLVYTT